MAPAVDAQVRNMMAIVGFVLALFAALLGVINAAFDYRQGPKNDGRFERMAIGWFGVTALFLMVAK